MKIVSSDRSHLRRMFLFRRTLKFDRKKRMKRCADRNGSGTYEHHSDDHNPEVQATEVVYLNDFEERLKTSGG